MIYAFSKKTYTSLEAAASEAVARIYQSGIGLRDGYIGPGHNNVRADAAAQAFTTQDIDLLSLSDDPLDRGFATILMMRRNYAALSLDAPEGKILLRQIYDQVQVLKANGWRAHSEPPTLTSGFHPAVRPAGTPDNADLNVDRAQLAALGDAWATLPDAAKRLLP